MNVGIIGLGLIGGSIALKIKEIHTNTVIYGLDKDVDSMSYSLSKGIIDKKFASLVNKKTCAGAIGNPN